MKIILLSLFGCLLFGCGAPSSQEGSSSQQDTTSAKLIVDSVRESPVEVKKPEEVPPLVISDSSANALNVLVSAQFDKIYADSINYYKITYTDYFDEYEGQATMRLNTWYLDKDFSIVYSMHSWEDGSMDEPDVDEYLVKDKLIICAKADYRGEYSTRKILLWDSQAGNVELAVSTYDRKTKSKGPIPADYITKSQEEWTARLTILVSDLDEEKVDNPDSEIYTLSTETPKPPDLKDYTVLVIPKIVFRKLKSDRN